MKINELERNIIKKSDAKLWPYKRSDYTKELPISIGEYDVLSKTHSQRAGDNISTISGIMVGVFDGETGVANMFISPSDYQGIKCYHVEYTFLNPKYQGQAIGYELYRGVIVLMGIPLITVGSQSPGARKTWLRLAQDPQITAYGLDIDRDIVFNLQANKNQTELKSSGKKIQVYDNYSTGIILVIKNGPYARKLEKLRRETQDRVGYYDPLFYDKLSVDKNIKKPTKPDIFGTKKFDPIT